MCACGLFPRKCKIKPNFVLDVSANSEVASGMGLELRNIICRFDIYGKIDKPLYFGGNDYQSDHGTWIEKCALWD